MKWTSLSARFFSEEDSDVKPGKFRAASGLLTFFTDVNKPPFENPETLAVVGQLRT
jgi:hypothetical protein